jgi:succinate-semialdehyde dehydrogenase/glutarate-semialdehyde dehydrogenase
VPNRIKDEFTKELAKRTDSLTVGRSSDFSMDIGSLTGYNQLQRVMGYVDDAVSTGATVVSGGTSVPETGPYFFRPTVMTNVNQNARMYRQEVFGPIIAVEGYEDLDEAIRLANDTELGLNASVVGPEREAMAVAKRLSAGGVNINEGFRATFASMETPMGGFKSSGQGRRNGPGGMLRYTEAKAIGISRGPIRLPSRAKDYNKMAPLMRLLIKWIK